MPDSPEQAEREAALEDGWQPHGAIVVCPACALQPFVHDDECPMPAMLAAARAAGRAEAAGRGQGVLVIITPRLLRWGEGRVELGRS